MEKYLQSKILTLTERLREIDREKLLVMAELRAYEDSLHHFISEKETVPEPKTAAAPKPKGSPSEFEMSKDWLNVMRELCKRGKAFSAGDMVNVGREIGFNTRTTNARSQLAFYAKKKYVRRVQRGMYAITGDGKAVFQKNEAPSGFPVGASQIAGEVDASPKSN